MPVITKVTGYCSKKKGRYWICWCEDGHSFSQNFTSWNLAIAFAKGLKRAEGEQIVSEESFFEQPEGPLYTLFMFAGTEEVGHNSGSIGRDLYSSGNAWIAKNPQRGFEIRRGEDVIVKGGNRA
jgi:hypothetical protein